MPDEPRPIAKSPAAIIVDVLLNFRHINVESNEAIAERILWDLEQNDIMVVTPVSPSAE